jgi:hypothetical protein
VGEGAGARSVDSTSAYHRDDLAAEDSDCEAGQDACSVDEHVADFELPARYQLLTELQRYAQQDHGECRRNGERSAF